jgi:Protein of unknown function (DUF2630)
MTVDDASLHAQIDKLVDEEQALLRAGVDQGEDPERHKRLQDIKVELDRIWDLLRQREAKEEFDLEVDDASERDTCTVEGYEG